MKAQDRILRVVLIAVFFLGIVVGSVFAQSASSDHFRMIDPSLTSGSGRSTSTGFALSGCLSLGPGGGYTSSNSFRMYSGCAALFMDASSAAAKPKTGKAGTIGNVPPTGSAATIDNSADKPAAETPH
jgi:hypothetical protein